MNKHKHPCLLFKFLYVFIFAAVAAFLWPHDVLAVDSYSFNPTWAAYQSNDSNEDVELTEAGCRPPATGACGSWISDRIGSYNLGIPRGRNLTKINIKRESGSQLGTGERLHWAFVTYTFFMNQAEFNGKIAFNQGGTVPLNNSSTTYYVPVATLSDEIGTQGSVSGGNGDGTNQVITVLYRVMPSTQGRTGDTTLLQQFYLPPGIGTAVYMNVKNVVMVDDYTALLEELNDHAWEIEQLLEQIADDSAGKQMEENKQETEQAQQDTNTQGSSSSSQADSSGQTLLQAFSSFIGALNVQAGSCNIDMDTGFIDFGEVNLCQLSPPPAFQAISSIVVIGFAVPLSLACARKIIELFRSFQS